MVDFVDEIAEDLGSRLASAHGYRLRQTLLAEILARAVFRVGQAVGVVDDHIPRLKFEFNRFEWILREPAERPSAAWQERDGAIGAAIDNRRVVPGVDV